MKNIFLNITGCFLLFLGANVNAQLISNGNLTPALTSTNLFMDASNFEGVANKSVGRGLGFPRTNLTTFNFITDPMDNTVILSDFDGMVVYNNTNGNTLTGQGVVTAVVPGFYYFSNPGNPGNITNGRWLPIGGSSKFNVTTAETTTNTLINNSPVYAKKGTFTASGTSTAPTAYSPAGGIAIPASGTAGIYRVTVFKAGTGSVFANEVYSYDITNGNLITGSPSMSVVYPAGVYDYIVEYTK